MREYLRHWIDYFFHSFTKYDIMALGWVLLLAILLIVLAAFIKRKGVGLFFILLGILLLFVAPIAIKIALDHYIRAASVTIQRVKPLLYSRTLLIEGTIHNQGKIDFSHCDLATIIFRPHAKLGHWFGYIKPKRTFLFPWPQPIARNESVSFRVVADIFLREPSDYNITIQPRCYP